MGETFVVKTKPTYSLLKFLQAKHAANVHLLVNYNPRDLQYSTFCVSCITATKLLDTILYHDTVGK